MAFGHGHLDLLCGDDAVPVGPLGALAHATLEVQEQPRPILVTRLHLTRSSLPWFRFAQKEQIRLGLVPRGV